MILIKIKEEEEEKLNKKSLANEDEDMNMIIKRVVFTKNINKTGNFFSIFPFLILLYYFLWVKRGIGSRFETVEIWHAEHVNIVRAINN